MSTDTERRIAEIVNEWFQGLPTPAEQQRDRSALIRDLVYEVERVMRESRMTVGKEIAQAIDDMPYELGDEGWKALENKAAEADWSVEWVRARRRRDDFTTATIETSYQYGYRRAILIAREHGKES